MRPALAAVAVAALLSTAAVAEERWQALRGSDARVQWAAPGMDARPEKAEGLTGPLGYRIERYFWKARETGGAFALAALRDFTETEHYISGKPDLVKSAALLLKGVDTPAITALDKEDRKLVTGFGAGIGRRVSLGVRECLSLALYAAPEKPVSEKSPLLTEGSLRVDALYCAKAGNPLAVEDLAALAKGLIPEPRKD